jgi:putative membrane protein
MRQLFESFTTFDDFLIYLAIALVLLVAYIAIYVRITPYREIALIREGNMAASFSLSGSVLGFVIPLSAAVQHSVNLADMAIWGVIALVIQVLAFVVVKLAVPSIPRDIPANNGAAGFFLGCMSLAVGVLNAACMSY